MKQLAKRLVVATQTCGWLGVLSVVLVYERASYFAWRIWPLLLLAVTVMWGLWLATSSWREVPANLAMEATAARKRKWLTWGQRKSKAKRA